MLARLLGKNAGRKEMREYFKKTIDASVARLEGEVVHTSYELARALKLSNIGSPDKENIGKLPKHIMADPSVENMA